MNDDAWVGPVETGVCKYRTTTVKWLIPKEMRDEGVELGGNDNMTAVGAISLIYLNTQPVNQ